VIRREPPGSGALHEVQRLGITHVRVKRIVRYYLIYSIIIYILYYHVVEIYAYRGAQSWWGARQVRYRVRARDARVA
jgi:hypothetical protein